MQINEKVHSIKIPFQIKKESGELIERVVYVYLIYGEEVYLIDSGLAASHEIICEYLEKTGRSCEEIALIIHTHSHPDHIGSSKILKELSGCAIAIHQNEVSWLEDIENQYQERPVPNFHQMVGGPVNVDIALEDNDVIELEENLQLEVIHTPGHSSGSISLKIPGANVIFTGDSIPVAGEIPIYDDFNECVSSLKKLKEIDDYQVLLESWDQPKSFDEAQEAIKDSLDYLDYIDQLVTEYESENDAIKPDDLVKYVLKELGLPENLANPLIYRSLKSHLKGSPG
ncbi:MAG: MBL fold metallo-hydrolase [Methanomicrobiales archaeon]